LDIEAFSLGLGDKEHLETTKQRTSKRKARDHKEKVVRATTID